MNSSYHSEYTYRGGRGGRGGGGSGRNRDSYETTENPSYNGFKNNKVFGQPYNSRGGRGGGGGGGGYFRGRGKIMSNSRVSYESEITPPPVSPIVSSDNSESKTHTNYDSVAEPYIIPSESSSDLDKTPTVAATAAAAAASSSTATPTELPSLYEGKTSFESWDDEILSLNDNILRGIYGYGFDTPSPIQKLSIIPIKYGRDIIAQAQSGTGKTGAFSIGALSRIDTSLPITQAILLAPTRELSEQIFKVINELGQFIKPRTALLIGGTSVAEDTERLRIETPHIVVGCPGRINDMLKRDVLSPSHVRLLVLDEADEMLSHGFNDQIYHIVRQLNKTAQIALFSATFPPELEPLTERFMREPLKMLVKKETINLAGILQYKVDLESDQQKYLVMMDIFRSISMSQCIIYCNAVSRVESLTRAMIKDEFPAVCIHSNMSTKERQDIINDFKKGKHRVLISSDITARGLDVQQVSVVVNFDFPRNKHTYLHRIGRSGRWGRKGIAINFITKRDAEYLSEIESWYGIKIEELPVNFGELIRTS